MSTEEKYELLNLPRCTTCGKAKKNFANAECCHNPNYLTWVELVKREEEAFKMMLRAEYILQQRLLTVDEAKTALGKITGFKHINLIGK